MTERERWIIYPLLFFALGASLRDKFLQHVTTKELQCQLLKVKQIQCEEVTVLDPTNPGRTVAKLLSGAPAGVPGAQAADRFGVLLLYDSQGQELCGVTNQALSVREINCFGLKVVDPDNQARALAQLTSAAAPPAQAGGQARRFGVLALNNQEFGRLLGFPPATPGGQTPAASQTPANDDSPAGEGETPPEAENEAGPAADPQDAER